MKIKDLNNRTDLTLVTDSQDVQAINDFLGWNDWEFQGYFVATQDGDYKAIYGFKGIIPDLNKDVTLLYDNGFYF